MFEEKEEFDVTISHNGIISIRKSTIVQKNGLEVARTYHRHVVTPGDDTSQEIEVVQSLSNLWTSEQIQVASEIKNESLIR